MKNDNIVTINGIRYDSVSGLPVTKSAAPHRTANLNKIADARSLHSLTQKSQTLYRRATQRPIAHGAQMIRKVGHHMDIARSKSISHFTKTTVTDSPRLSLNRGSLDIAPQKHHLVKKAEKNHSISSRKPVPKPVLSKPAKVIKEEAIDQALRKADEKPKKSKSLRRRLKFLNISLIILILLVFGGALLYYNFPNLSVRIAGAQAGINATFPTYFPDGYSLTGPVTYSEGNVTMDFRANTGNTKFTIEQTKSTWDSTAVKAKVEKDSKGEFIATKDQGLTIYTYNGNAAWVNGGILYMITGDAPLSGDQIRRIAVSL